MDGNNSWEIINDLRQEISQLKSELDRSTEENVKAAEYGLLMLEEKRLLQAQLEESEGLLENTKHELNCAKEVSILKTSASMFYFCTFCRYVYV